MGRGMNELITNLYHKASILPPKSSGGSKRGLTFWGITSAPKGGPSPRRRWRRSSLVRAGFMSKRGVGDTPLGLGRTSDGGTRGCGQGWGHHISGGRTRKQRPSPPSCGLARPDPGHSRPCLPSCVIARPEPKEPTKLFHGNSLLGK